MFGHIVQKLAGVAREQLFSQHDPFSLQLSGYASVFQRDSLTEDTDLIPGMMLSVSL